MKIAIQEIVTMHVCITTHIGSSLPVLPIVASASLRSLYSLLYSEHINYIQVFGFLPFTYPSCMQSPRSVWPVSNNGKWYLKVILLGKKSEWDTVNSMIKDFGNISNIPYFPFCFSSKCEHCILKQFLVSCLCFVLFFVFLWWYWGLNSGLFIC
jgi:hypothetical protein